MAVSDAGGFIDTDTVPGSWCAEGYSDRQPVPHDCRARGLRLDCGMLFAARKRGKDTLTGERGFLCHACQPGSARLGAEQTIPLSGRYVVIDIGSMQPG